MVPTAEGAGAPGSADNWGDYGTTKMLGDYLFFNNPDGDSSATGANDDQNVGIHILRRALEEPLRQIVVNAGEDGSVILNKVKEGVTSLVEVNRVTIE